MMSRWRVVGLSASVCGLFLLASLFALLLVRQDTHTEAREVALLESQLVRANQRLQSLESAVADATRAPVLLKRVEGVLVRPVEGQVVRVRAESRAVSAVSRQLVYHEEGRTL